MKTKHIQQIFIFLLATAGITYSVYWIMSKVRSSKEGFQAAASAQSDAITLALESEIIKSCQDAKRACTSYSGLDSVGGAPVYLCSNSPTDLTKGEMNALALLECDRTLGDVQSATPPQLWQLGMNDIVCYQKVSANLIGSNYYVCYQRPPTTYFDNATGQYQFLNPSDPSQYDPVPDQQASEIDSACKSYQTSYVMAARTYSTIKSNQVYVDDKLSLLNNVYTTLSTLSSSYCTSATISINPSQQKTNACQNLAAKMPVMDDLINNVRTNPLLNISTTLQATRLNLYDIIQNNITKSFDGIDCVKPKLPFQLEF